MTYGLFHTTGLLLVMPSIPPDDEEAALPADHAPPAGTPLAPASGMTPSNDSDCVDLTVGAPQLDPDQATLAADAVAAERQPPGDGYRWLFDGHGCQHWASAGAGSFVLVDDRLESVPGNDLGLFWCTVPTPPDFVLRLQWLRWRHEDTSGVFVRFPRPETYPDCNSAFGAIYQGFEVQIDEIGLPGASAIHRTGAIFGARDQNLRPATVRPPAEWNDLEITARGQRYTVRLNGQLTSEFDNPNPARGCPSTGAAPSFVGLQLSPGSRVAFRRIAIKAL